MPLEQFTIYLDNPSMSYFPGQMVTGKVLVHPRQEKKSQGLKLKFEGRASVHWTEEHTKTVGTGDDKRQEKYTKSYNDSESFFDFKNYLLGDGRSDVYIPAGQNFYPFAFQLPPMNLPSSYVGAHGKVEYILEANINRSWKFDYNVKQCITVNAIVDLNNDLQAAQPITGQKIKTFCCWCCASGPLTVGVSLQRRGYVPGEPVPLEVNINNSGNRVVKWINAKIYQEAIFFAEGSKKQSNSTIIKECSTQDEIKDIQPGDSEIWRKNLLLPPIPPTKLGGCRIIDVQYNLEVEVEVKGLAFNVTQTFPLTIGTVPLRVQFQELQPVESVPVPTALPSAPPMFTPNGYPDLPQPQYQDSFNFNADAPKPDTIVGNIANTVVDNVIPPQPDYVPKYVTYGWKFSLPPPPQ